MKHTVILHGGFIRSQQDSLCNFHIGRGLRFNVLLFSLCILTRKDGSKSTRRSSLAKRIWSGSGVQIWMTYEIYQGLPSASIHQW